MRVIKPLIQSPLNYTGGKYKLLKQILPLFPQDIDVFVDLFCGGCNVGVNVEAQSVVLNDINSNLLYLYDILKRFNKADVLAMIDIIIKTYGLSESSKKGYAFYGCDGSSGLGSYNKEPFKRLREAFIKKALDHEYYIMLYVLIVFSFNNQIRFNSKGEFNLPVGKRDFNDKMKSKLCSFIDRLQQGNYTFSREDFRSFDVSILTTNSLVYCDPPYLITCATYNENDGWGEQSEKELLKFLDSLNQKGIRFALSNVLSSKGKKNTILSNWATKYTIHRLKYDYSNCNYQTKDKTQTTEEVLVVNY